MDPAWVQVVQTILVAAAALLGGFATWRTAHTQSEDAEGKRLEAHMDRQDRRIEALELENERAKRRELARDDYIQQLRKHISDGSPPPPPPWPNTLLSEFERK